MPKSIRPRSRRRRGSALITTFAVLTVLSVASVTYMDRATQTVRIAHRQTMDVQGTHLCEAAVQQALRNLWRPFRVEQAFDTLDATLNGASGNNPRAAIAGELDGVGRYSAAVVGYATSADGFARTVTVRAVGWFDRDGDGSLGDEEPRKTVDVTATFELARSQVFDYTYFINNYGWMKGFRPDWLIVNGDMRSNGNFEFLRNNGDNSTGSGTMNGSVVASPNEKLEDDNEGLILFEGSTENVAPVKTGQSTYNSQATSQRFWRQGYDPAVHGARDSATYNQWRDFIFDHEGNILRDSNNRGRPSGAVLADALGTRHWRRESLGQSPTYRQLDSTSTSEVIMPDLSDLDYYLNLSRNYRNPKQTFSDGTANGMYNRPAYAERWDSTYVNSDGTVGRWEVITAPVQKDAQGRPMTDSQGRPRYIDVNADGIHDWRDSQGFVEGSIAIVGSSLRPIRINGPVTVTEDLVIKGHVTGQGTFYTGRNVHIVGNTRYLNEPDFRRTGGRNTFTQIEQWNEKRDFLGLAARGSIIMGNTTQFGDATLQYMRPPWTNGRYDENGNWVPAFNAMDVDGRKTDGTNRRKFEPTFSNTQINALSDPGVNRVDAVLYSNFVGGGNVGTGGGGMTLNGTIISRDEAIVAWSVPIRLNYDHRIRERTATRNPLIDLQLPRSPRLTRQTWQDRGFGEG